MPRTRGEANRALYRARILLEAWDRLRVEARHAESVLIGAFVPAVRLHLRDAYGWFLLSVSGVDDSLAADLPGSTRDLPAPPAGKALIPELAEFSQLENTGWLAQLLAGEPEAGYDGPVAAGRGASQGLLVSDREPLGYAVVLAWADALTAIMSRMDDSLAEY
ncbi:hypothetical protein R0135_03530 [Congregibacter variabilis]|uniref:Uncharacterized protein n=1 Tax=Congregibacter variabilis TaxID=3081200 RepID=A0ABZ0I5Y8_9GAMM|nr:hypothetical protein R0135_03530 [Congregibacter sp. IMCC43200]